MDPTTSTTPSTDRPFIPSQSVADRIARALRHRLRLLHRSHANFYVLGATGNVYTVTLSHLPTCTCPDRRPPCKHILFVYLRVLRLPLDDACLRKRTLRPCHLYRLLDAPTWPESLAGPRARERFHQLFSNRIADHVKKSSGPTAAAEEGVVGATCPVCLEEMVGKEEKVVTCGVCRNSLHEECLMRWKRSSRRRTASCVLCRARWREKKEEERYINLAAYVSDEEEERGGGVEGSLCEI